MSTYYALCCDTCHVMTDLVSGTTLEPFVWMARATEHVPVFIARDSGHLDAMRVISEHDPRWSHYSHYKDIEDNLDNMEETIPC